MNADPSPFTDILGRFVPMLLMLVGLIFFSRYIGAQRKRTLAAFKEMERETGGKLSMSSGSPALHLTRKGATIWLFIDVSGGRNSSVCTKVKARGFPAGSFTLGAYSRALVARSAGKSVKTQDEKFDKQFSVSVAASATGYVADIFTYSLKDAMDEFQTASGGKAFLRIEAGELTLGRTGRPPDAAALKRFYEAALKVMDELKAGLGPIEHILPGNQ